MPRRPVSVRRPPGWQRGLFAALASVCATGCDTCAPTPHEIRARCPSAPQPYEPSKAQKERDEILMRLAWGLSAGAIEQASTASVQAAELGAAVAITTDGAALCWAHSAEHALDHPPQRALRLAAARAPGAQWVLYTTHEPCPHCTGAALQLPVQGIRFDVDVGTGG